MMTFADFLNHLMLDVYYVCRHLVFKTTLPVSIRPLRGHSSVLSFLSLYLQPPHLLRQDRNTTQKREAQFIKTCLLKFQQSVQNQSNKVHTALNDNNDALSNKLQNKEDDENHVCVSFLKSLWPPSFCF